MRRQWPTCSANGGLIEGGGSCWGVCYSSCAAAQPSVRTHSSTAALPARGVAAPSPPSPPSPSPLRQKRYYSHAEKLSRGFVAESMHTVVGKLDLKTSLTHKTAEEWKRQDHLRVKSAGLRKGPVAGAVARVERGYPRTIPGFSECEPTTEVNGSLFLAKRRSDTQKKTLSMLLIFFTRALASDLMLTPSIKISVLPEHRSAPTVSVSVRLLRYSFSLVSRYGQSEQLPVGLCLLPPFRTRSLKSHTIRKRKAKSACASFFRGVTKG